MSLFREAITEMVKDQFPNSEVTEFGEDSIAIRFNIYEVKIKFVDGQEDGELGATIEYSGCHLFNKNMPLFNVLHSSREKLNIREENVKATTIYELIEMIQEYVGQLYHGKRTD